MSRNRSRRPAQTTKMRGPSRPIDPRYAPGRPVRRGPDRFGMMMIGVSTIVALMVILFIVLANRNSPTATTTTGNPGNTTLNPPTAGTATAIAFATQVAPLPRISAQEAKALFDANNARFIDVRVKTSYDQQHIKGAVSIPQGEAQARVSEFPRTGNVILYCQ